MSDPFLLDQATLELKLRQLQDGFDRWRQIRDCRDVAEFVASADEFNWLCVELSQGIKNAGWDLDDLEETLKLMSESRQLSDAELRTRRQFIANTRQLLSHISGEVLPSGGGRMGGGGAPSGSDRRGGQPGDSEVLTTTTISVDHFAEEPASLDLLDPADYRGGGGGGDGGRVSVAAWKRRLGAAVTFGPLRQIGLADSGGGGDGGCWQCLAKHRLRLLVAAALALLVGLLVAGIVAAARRGGAGAGIGAGVNATATLAANATKLPRT